MTYRELLTAAAQVPAGDRHGANAWLLQLAAVLKAGELMPAQRSYLYRLRRIWRRRAAGEDARWNVYGCEPGNLAQKPAIVAPAPPTPEEPTISAKRLDSGETAGQPSHHSPEVSPSSSTTQGVRHADVAATGATGRDSQPSGKPSAPQPEPVSETSKHDAQPVRPASATPATPWPGVSPNKANPQPPRPGISSLLEKYGR